MNHREKRNMSYEVLKVKDWLNKEKHLEQMKENVIKHLHENSRGPNAPVFISTVWVFKSIFGFTLDKTK